MAHSVCHMEGAARPSRLGRSASLAVAATVLALVALAAAGNEVHAGSRSQGRSLPLTLAIPSMTSPRGTQQLVQALNELVARSPMTLTAAIEQLVQQSGASAGVSLVEIGGAIPFEWSFNGDAVFTAASTYKLAVLMMEAQNIASGKTSAGGSVCFQDADYEAGWYHDYEPGACFTRTELARRAGQMSDNTAGHMLVRDVGGPDVLNAWAASVGTKESVFFTNNTTSANDLAALWAAEARGSLGGTHARRRAIGRKHERRFREIELQRDGLHREFVEATGVLDDAQRIAGEGRLRKNVHDAKRILGHADTTGSSVESRVRASSRKCASSMLLACSMRPCSWRGKLRAVERVYSGS